MNKWFYAKDGQAIGPLSTPEMHELIGQGACTRTTLVWTRGMRDWLPACMATWMWEERSERRDVTAEPHDETDATGGSDAVAPSDAAQEAPAVPSDSTARRNATMSTAHPSSADAAVGSGGEGGDAGVVGMVRKLFGLG